MIELTGVEPFLTGGVRHVDRREEPLQLRIDLSRVRRMDPLTVLGSALMVERACARGEDARVVLPCDEAGVGRAAALGLLQWLKPEWCDGRLPEPRAGPPENCLQLRPLAPQGGSNEFVSRCMDMVADHGPNGRLPRAVGQVLVELIDNAVVHSRSPVPTYAIAEIVPAGVNGGPCMEVAVGDGGVGMRVTLRARYARVSRSVDALREAFKPKVSQAEPHDSYHFGVGLHIVREEVRLGPPGAELVVLSGNAVARLRSGRRTHYGPRSGCPVALSHLQQSGTWVRLRMPLGLTL